MTTQNVPGSFADDETIVDFVGGGADSQVAQVGLITDHERSGAREVYHKDVLEGFHNSTDLAGLRLPPYDVERLPAHFDLNTADASIVEAWSAPWNLGRVFNTAQKGTHRHAPSILAAFTCDATRHEVYQYSDSGYGADEYSDERHAHSSTNGISQWEDFSIGHEWLEASYSSHRTESTAPTVPNVQNPSGSTASEGSSNKAGAISLHECISCNKSFSSKEGLRHHRETHDKVKMNAHRCSECQRGFRYPKDVERHLKTHEQEENREEHLCPKAGCFKTFMRKDNLKRHLKKTHHE